MSENLYTLAFKVGLGKIWRYFTCRARWFTRPIDDYITTASDGRQSTKLEILKIQQKYIYETAEKIKNLKYEKITIIVEGDFILSNSMSFGKLHTL